MNDDGARVASLSLRAPRSKDAASCVLAAHASFSRLCAAHRRPLILRGAHPSNLCLHAAARAMSVIYCACDSRALAESPHYLSWQARVWLPGAPARSPRSSSKHAASEALSRCCILLAWALSMLRGACLRPARVCARRSRRKQPPMRLGLTASSSLSQGDPMVLLLARLPLCTRSDLIDALGMSLVPRGGAVALCSSPTYVACPARSARSSARSPPTCALLRALLRRSAFSSQLALMTRCPCVSSLSCQAPRPLETTCTVSCGARHRCRCTLSLAAPMC